LGNVQMPQASGMLGVEAIPLPGQELRGYWRLPLDPADKKVAEKQTPYPASSYVPTFMPEWKKVAGCCPGITYPGQRGARSPCCSLHRGGEGRQDLPEENTSLGPGGCQAWANGAVPPEADNGIRYYYTHGSLLHGGEARILAGKEAAQKRLAPL